MTRNVGPSKGSLRRKAARALVGVALVGGTLVLVAILPTVLRRDAVTFTFEGVVGAEELSGPIGLAISGGRLFVTDASLNRVFVFDRSGNALDIWDGVSLGLERPMHVSSDSAGLLYVADYLRDRIVVLDGGGQVKGQLGRGNGSAPGQLDAPGGAARLGDQVFAADFFNHRIEPVSTPGQPSLGRPGRFLKGRLNYPTDVATADSLIFVADAYNNRVQVFEPNGEVNRVWGGPLGLGIPGRGRGWFRVAAGIHVAGDLVFVADFFNDRVQVFDRDGRYQGSIVDSLSLPTDVAVDGSGTVYVVDFGNKRVVRFKAGPR